MLMLSNEQERAVGHTYNCLRVNSVYGSLTLAILGNPGTGTASAQ
jgi:hypothetical protein